MWRVWNGLDLIFKPHRAIRIHKTEPLVNGCRKTWGEDGNVTMSRFIRFNKDIGKVFFLREEQNMISWPGTLGPQGPYNDCNCSPAAWNQLRKVRIFRPSSYIGQADTSTQSFQLWMRSPHCKPWKEHLTWHICPKESSGNGTEGFALPWWRRADQRSHAHPYSTCWTGRMSWLQALHYIRPCPSRRVPQVVGRQEL